MPIDRPAAALLLLLAGCSAAPAGAPAPEPPDVRIVRGSRYDKSVYGYEGKTIVTFGIEVRNLGTDAGRATDPHCHVSIRGTRYELEVHQNPELEPGERGELLAGGPIPHLGHAGVDDLEAFCGL